MPGSASTRLVTFLIVIGVVVTAAVLMMSSDEPTDATVTSTDRAAGSTEADAPAIEEVAVTAVVAETRRDAVADETPIESPVGPPADYVKSLGGIVGRLVETDLTPVVDLPLELIGVSMDEVFVGTSALFEGPASYGLELVKGSTRTDEEGRFRFAGVDPRGMHALAIDAGGARAGIRLVDSSPNSEEERDLGDIILEPFVTFTGRVVDMDDTPIAGARVRATNIPAIAFQFGAADVHEDGGVLFEDPRKGGEWGVFRFPPIVRKVLERVPIPATETAEDGTFILAGVPLGIVSVLVDEPGFVTLVHGPVPTGAGGGERSIGTLTIDEGDELAGVAKTANDIVVAGAEIMFGAKTQVGEAALLRPGGVTDADGRFHLLGLSDDDHFVAARKAGGVDWTVLADVSPGDTDLELVFPAEHDLRVIAVAKDGQPISRPDLLLNEIGEEGALAASVILGPRPLAARTRYTEDGVAVVEGLGARLYRVLVRAEGYAATDVEADLSEGATEIHVELGPARAVKVRVVRAADGAPVAWARVQAFQRDTEFDIEGMPFASRRTDDDGFVELSGVPEEGCNLRVVHPAFAVADRAAVDTDVEVKVPLFEGGSLKGRVHAGGQPVTDPRFIAVASDDAVLMPRFVTSDLEGGFELTRLQPGEYELTVMPRFANQQGVVNLAQSMMTLGMPERQVEFVIREGQETWVDIDILGVDGDMRTANLNGRVFINGHPGANATVTAMPHGEWQGRKSTRAGADGRFDFGQVGIGDSGKVNLVVSPAGYSNNQWWMGGFHNQVLHLPEGTSRTVLIEVRTGSIAGRVIDDKTGRPIPQASVVVRSAHANQNMGMMFGGSSGEVTAPPPQSEEPPPMSGMAVQAGADGRFEVPMIPAGKYEVVVEHDGYAEATVGPIDIPSGGAARAVTVRVKGAVIVAGSIVFPEGVGEDDGWFRFRKPEGAEGLDDTWTQVSDGKFETDELGSGEWEAVYTVWGDQAAHAEYKAKFTVPDTGLQGVVLHLQQTSGH